MKLRTIAMFTVFTLPFSLSLSFAAGADEPEQPCQAYLDTSNGTDDEENN